MMYNTISETFPSVMNISSDLEPILQDHGLKVVESKNNSCERGLYVSLSSYGSLKSTRRIAFST